MSEYAEFVGGGGTPIGANAQFGLGAPAYIASNGQEFLKQGSLVAYSANYAAALSAGLGVWGNNNTYANANTSTETLIRYHYVGANYVAFTASATPYYASALNGTWTTTGAVTPAGYRKSSYGNGSYIVYAHNSINQAPLYSSNGSAFSAVGGAFTTFPVASAVCFGNNIWVALSTLSGTAGEQAYIANANPSGSWTVGATTNIGMTAVNAIAYGNGVFVAGGTSSSAYGKIATCTTPAGGWTDRTSGSGFTFASGNGLYDVVFNGTYFFAVANTTSHGNALIRSSDGITWTHIANIPFAPNSITLLEASPSGRLVVCFPPTTGADAVFVSTADHGATWNVGRLYAGKVGVAANRHALSFVNNKWVMNHSGNYLNPGDYGSLDMTTPDYIGFNYASVGQLSVSGGTSSIYVPAHVRIK